MYYADEYAQKIIDSKSIVIYGARIVAKEVANCLLMNPYNREIDAFMVSSKDGNPEYFMGKPVVTICEGCESYKQSLILVSVLERYIPEIKNNLESYGFQNVLYLGFESDLWSCIRGNCFREICINKYGVYKTFEDEIRKKCSDSNASVSIFAAKCHVDKELNDKRVYPFEKQIQVGTSLTDKIVCDIRDNMGDNISDKNKKYCELTALYWIWKNDSSDYKGLCHYRRHFDFTPDMVEKLPCSAIDVVVTIPILNFPSVREMYQNDHSIEDWDIMLGVLKEIHPDYIDTAIELQDGIYYYAYNMFIARREIYDEYCSWLFPILFECEKRIKPKEDGYQGRVIGFLAERLLSVFFLHNWNRWNIVHAKKNFLM